MMPKSHLIYLINLCSNNQYEGRGKKTENKCESTVCTSKVVDSSNFVAVRGTWPSPNRTDNFSKEQNDGRRARREICFTFYQSLQPGRSK